MRELNKRQKRLLTSFYFAAPTEYFYGLYGKSMWSRLDRDQQRALETAGDYESIVQDVNRYLTDLMMHN